MALDPEKAWRAPGQKPYVLQERDNVFIALQGTLPSEYAQIAAAAARDLGLVPFWYSGLDKIAASQAVNVSLEAVGDLYKCQAAVSILSGSPIEHDWIFREISSRQSWGVAVLAYELEADENENRASDHHKLFPSDVKIQVIQPAALGDVLRHDLSLLSQTR